MGIPAVTEVLVVGTGLRRPGMADAVVIDDAVAYDFDERSDLWRVESRDRLAYYPRIVITTPDALPRFRREWRADLELFRGVATHGLPNVFLMTPHRASAPYIARCVAELTPRGATRVEVRAGVQHEFSRRVRSKRMTYRGPFNPDHFEWTTAADREPLEEYAGMATLHSGDERVPVQVALAGHLEPIDGNYHWYGRITARDAVTALKGRPGLSLALPDRDPVPARLTEVDPLGNARVCGVGSPPYPLATLETL